MKAESKRRFLDGGNPGKYPRGMPKKPKDLKTVTVRVRLTQAEKDLIDEAVDTSPLDFSNWARLVLIEEARRVMKKCGADRDGGK